MPTVPSLLHPLRILMLTAALFGSAIQAQDTLTILGLCPTATGRLDNYMQALCAGETALAAGNATEAIARFRFAASLPRIDATHELAWAGLAVAHCRARAFDSAALWSAHFTQARQLWLGELDCDAAENDARARLSPFVRSRMCSSRLSADYALLREYPAAPHTLDLQARLARIADGIARSCAAAASSTNSGATRSERNAAKKVKAKSKRPRRAASASRSKPQQN